MLKKFINNVVIVGGTHGNEFTGSYLAKFWQSNLPFPVQQSLLSIERIISLS